MRIVLDAMGADAAPDPEVRGAVEAAYDRAAASGRPQTVH